MSCTIRWERLAPGECEVCAKKRLVLASSNVNQSGYTAPVRRTCQTEPPAAACGSAWWPRRRRRRRRQAGGHGCRASPRRARAASGTRRRRPSLRRRRRAARRAWLGGGQRQHGGGEVEARVGMCLVVSRDLEHRRHPERRRCLLSARRLAGEHQRRSSSS